MATTSSAEILLAVISGGYNGSDNNTYTVSNEHESPPQGLLDFLERITSPIVCLVGTVLNLMSVGTFLSRSLKRISCCLYLATRSLAVFGFLISVLFALTPLMNTEGFCELTVFLSYFCPFISVWMVVIISMENFIRISQPSRVVKLCTPSVAQYTIGVFVVLGLIVYNFPLWTTRVFDGQCRVLSEYYQVVLVLNYIDMALTLICPSVVMLIVVPLVGLSAISAYERKKRLNSRRCVVAQSHRLQAAECKSSPETRVTRLLFAVSVVFLLLHTPFHVIRIKISILSFIGTFPSKMDFIIMHVFRLIYNLDTCVSCAVYLIFGDNFRRIFYTKYFSSCQPKRAETSATEETIATYVRSDESMEVNMLKHGNGAVEDSKMSERLLTEHDV